MSDYTQEIRVSKEILARAVEAYRKIRNTLRYLLANLYDFDPALDAVRPRAARGGRPLHPGPLRATWPTRVLRALRRLRLRHDLPGAQRVRDGRPERVLRRRVEGSAVHVRARLARAPVGADGDVRHRRRPDAPAGARSCRSRPTSSGGTCPARARTRCTSRSSRRARTSTRSPTPRSWRRGIGCGAIRDQVLAEIEPLRKDKQIGSSLQAKVVLTPAPARSARSSSATQAQLPMLFIVSEVELRAARPPTEGEDAAHRRSSAPPA